MLARDFKFVVKNDTGVTIEQNAITINGRKYKGSSDGTVEFESAEETSMYINDATAGIVDGAYEGGDAFDNSGTADEWVGGAFELTVAIPSSTGAATYAGNIEVYYHPSTDGGTTFADDGEGHLVCVLALATTITSATATFVKTFEL